MREKGGRRGGEGSEVAYGKYNILGKKTKREEKKRGWMTDLSILILVLNSLFLFCSFFLPFVLCFSFFVFRSSRVV